MVMEMDGSFVEILGRMDTGWQDRQATNVVLEGRGFEWGKDWRIWCANLKQANRYRGVVVEVTSPPNFLKPGFPSPTPLSMNKVTDEIQYLPSNSLPYAKALLTEFAERHIFYTGEEVKPFWGKKIYQGEDAMDKEFQEWHTAMQYIEMIQSVVGRRRGSSTALE